MDSLRQKANELQDYLSANELWREISSHKSLCSSNDYLGLRKDAEVREALSEGALRYGSGSGASPFLGGYCEAHECLAHEVCATLGVEKALVFVSGYQANVAVGSLMRYLDARVLCDEECHRSLFDGLVMNKVSFRRFEHNNVDQCRTKTGNVVCVEGLYSMSGSVGLLDDFSKLVLATKKCLIVDEAHSFGVLPVQQGTGHLRIITLGKSVGLSGAVIAGDTWMIEAIVQSASSLRYSTALSPALAHAATVSIRKIKQETWRREQLMKHIAEIRSYAMRCNIPLEGNEQSPIQIIRIKHLSQPSELLKRLAKKELVVPVIRPPTVKNGEQCFRLSITNHTDIFQVKAFLDCVQTCL
ncbi:MAG: aminotransferase class I/II-fold pyridoxal phosphate-dependent enzyme [Methylacidiphilales bacterium]|nr:aminotransferase class I/II-fold pyridoxal phosphate-dependent enzyme [Candidatus Methylacidiphilales bacterium]